MRTLLLTLTTCLLVLPVQAKYSGGSGTAQDPYQIATAADLILLGETPADYDKHLLLTADLDLDPNLPGRKVFTRAVLAPDVNDSTWWSSEGTPFTGVFNGGGHTISHLTVAGRAFVGLFGYLASKAEVKALGVVDVSITGSCYVGGLAGSNGLGQQARGSSVTDCYCTGLVSGTGERSYVGGLVGSNSGAISRCHTTAMVRGNEHVGGLAGLNYDYGNVTQCYSTGAVTGKDWVGGLVGANSGGTVTNCYSTGAVSADLRVGGLVGSTWSALTNCYSTSPVSGTLFVGGLVGLNDYAAVTTCFWDTQTSGQTTSAGGTGKTTAQMRMASTFLGWGACGSLWTIKEGQDYPHLAWENVPGQVITGPTYGGGAGTAQDPYLIYAAYDLESLSLAPCHWDKHFRLMADIDLDPNLPGRKVFDKAVIAPDLQPSANYFQGTPFTGVFDGDHHTISHLTITGKRYLGLFGRLEGAEVRNLGIVDVKIDSSRDYYWTYCVGALAGDNAGGRVVQCYSTGVVSANRWVGGLVGVNGGAVIQSYNTAVIRTSRAGDGGGGWGIGGLVGINNGIVTRCYNTGAVNGWYYVPWSASASSSMAYPGSIVEGSGPGYHVAGPGETPQDSGSLHINYISPSRGDDHVGGLVGINESGGVVTHCYNKGAVVATGAVGGLVGGNDGTVSHCYSTGTIRGSEWNVGGLVGGNMGTVTCCYSTGLVPDRKEHIGGLVGYNSEGDVIQCFWDTQTSSQTKSAGGTGLTTAQMQDVRTYLEGGWDFVGEISNGTHEAWQMPEGGGYPVLAILSGYTPVLLQGQGTPDDPYLISDARELGAMIYYDSRAHYRLGAAIDLSGICWCVAPVPYLEGTFDGHGLTISHLKVTGGGHLGLFGQLGGEVRDLGVVKVYISGSGSFVGGLAGSRGNLTQCYSTGSVSGRDSVGGLVGAHGNLTRCYSAVTVSGDTDVGGLVGYWPGGVTHCYSTGAVTGNKNVGGLVGNNTVDLIQCYSSGAVDGNDGVGGLVGISEYGTVRGCYWDVQTSGQIVSAGGIGLTTAQMQTAQVFGLWVDGPDGAVWTIAEGRDYPRLLWENRPGTVILPVRLGDFVAGAGTADAPYLIYTPAQLNLIGLAPWEWDKHFKLMADIDLSGLTGMEFHVIGADGYTPFKGVFDGNGKTIAHLTYDLAGRDGAGLFGCVAGGDSQIKDLRLTDPNVRGRRDVGSLAGWSDARIEDCRIEGGSMTGTDSVGGLVGANYGPMTRCSSTTAVRGMDRIGGLAGTNGGDVTQCASTSQITGNLSIGGLIGSNDFGDVGQSYSFAAVDGNSAVGGLVGATWAGTISNCYSQARVSGRSAVGGLVGGSYQECDEDSIIWPISCASARITHCYAAGPVVGGSDIGGLLGCNEGSVVGCLWDATTTGQATSAGGTGKTTAEMQTARTFLDAGWDFVGETKNGTEDIWWILEGRDYPRLWWEARN